jgi:hypothetical protein
MEMPPRTPIGKASAATGAVTAGARIKIMFGCLTDGRRRIAAGCERRERAVLCAVALAATVPVGP